MRSGFKIECVAALVAGLVLFSTSLHAARPGLTPASPPPAAVPSFQPGDILSIASEIAELMRGEQVLASLQRGHRIVVAEVRDPWIGVHVLLEGEKKAGWIRIHDFLPTAVAAQPQGKAISAAVSDAQSRVPATPALFVAEAAETTAPVAERTSAIAERAHADAFLIGKYDRHETDPNVHVWEPWRR